MVEITTVDVSIFDQTVFDQVKNIVNGAIIDYQTVNSGSNLINMAKVKQFTDFLTAKIGVHFIVV